MNAIEQKFVEMLSIINDDPKTILTLDYDIMLDFIYVLYAKGHRDIAARCIYAGVDKYGDKIYGDLKSNSEKLILAAHGQ